MTTHSDNVTTWRDLADALTPAQVSYLEQWESHPEVPPLADGVSAPRKTTQRPYYSRRANTSARTLLRLLYADVAPPAEDGTYYPWEHIGDGRWIRFFTGTEREVGETTVRITGMQYADGTIIRTITGHCEDVDAATARLLAAALIEAADELEHLQ
ncbi:hypothetical protein [Mycobacterium sp. ZZG]